MNLTHFLLAGIVMMVVRAGHAHPGHGETAATLFAALDSDSAPATTANSTGNKATISLENGYRVFRANGLPDHTPGQFPNRGNPNSISAQSYTFRVTLQPQTNSTPRNGRGAW